MSGFDHGVGRTARGGMARGFTVVVIPLILVISMIVLGIMLANKPGAAGTTASSAYNAGKQWGPVVGSILFGLFMLGLASRIAENRDHKTATLIIGGILLLANFAFLMNVLGLAKPLPANQRGGNIAKLLGGNQPAPSNPAPANPLSSNPAPAAPAAERPVSQPNAPRPRPQPPTPSQDAAAPQEARPTPRPAPPPAKSAIPEPQSADFAEVAAYLTAELPAAKAPLEALAKELGDAVADLSMKSALFVPDALATPKHDRPALKKRREDAQAIKTLADSAAKRLDDALEEAKRRLKAAGIPDHEQMSLAIRFSTMTRTNTRSFAAADYSRFADDVLEEATLLEKHFAKWKLDKDKKITSEDFKVRGELTGPRMRVESFEHRAERTAEGLGGQ